ncbi:MAG: hypothetical protein KDK07_16025 [Bauldia sp.]|nr:hypothetical protein [Bauldia sp.]
MIRCMLVAASAVVCLATPSLAAPVAVDFTARSTNSGSMYMTGEADGLFHSNSAWDAVGEEGGAMAGLSGPCFGSGRVSGGKMSGDGYCAFKDAEGNMALVHWWLDNSAALGGVWSLAGGTGKWATATGGGTWSDSPGDGENIMMTHIIGVVDMK